MTSPASEIVVSNEPHLSSAQSVDEDKEPSPEIKPEPDAAAAEASHPHDPNSKKSFKRKYATVCEHMLTQIPKTIPKIQGNKNTE